MWRGGRGGEEAEETGALTTGGEGEGCGWGCGCGCDCGCSCACGCGRRIVVVVVVGVRRTEAVGARVGVVCGGSAKVEAEAPEAVALGLSGAECCE